MYEKSNKCEETWRSMRIETYLYYDLDINEVAMKIHRVMKLMQDMNECQTITTFIEKTYVETEDVGNSKYELKKQTQKYSLLIIASQNRLTREQLSKIFKNFGQFDQNQNVRI